MKQKLIEFVGWYGTFAIVGAYVLVSFGFLTPSTIWYQLLNLTGGIGVIIISFYKKAYQPGVLNILWAIIAFVAIVKILFVH